MKFRDYTEIVFEAGDILSADMLAETYRYPRDLLHLFSAAHGDGIISGLDFVTDHGDVYLTAGIVKMDRKYYVLAEAVNMEEWLRQHRPSLQSSVEYCLCLRSEDALSAGNRPCGIKTRSRMTLRAETERAPHTLLLGKYKFLQETKITLPSVCRDDAGDPFDDFFRRGLLQLLESDYAHAQGGTTYHPLIFRALREYLERKSPLSPYDFTLLTEIQNHGIVAIASLMAYIAATKKSSLPSSDMPRENLFREVVACVKTPYAPIVYRETPPELPIKEPEKESSQSKLLS